jgi:hypothetical protein
VRGHPLSQLRRVYGLPEVSAAQEVREALMDVGPQRAVKLPYLLVTSTAEFEGSRCCTAAPTSAPSRPFPTRLPNGPYR